jgi:rhodanese-related sulfurtransferase
LEILDLLCQTPRTVEGLARETGLSSANTSQHLQVLRSARLVEAERNGLFVTYRLADEVVCDFFRALRTLAESRLAEIERILRDYVRDRSTMEVVDRGELIERVRRGEVTVIDVRPTDEYRAGHIPGALSIPLEELKSRMDELPGDSDVVAYCRGPYCLLAVDAVEWLRDRGFTADRLEHSVSDWKALGFDVERA